MSSWHEMHRLDRAAKLGQHAVAAGADDAAFVPGDQPVDHVAILAEGFNLTESQKSSKYSRFLGRNYKILWCDASFIID